MGFTADSIFLILFFALGFCWLLAWAAFHPAGGAIHILPGVAAISLIAHFFAGAHGRITLAVCNTVERARRTFDALKGSCGATQLELIHSRFRQADREHWRDLFLSRSACTPGADRIIVSTQVVEAGVDISAVALITELAPWSSLVQRFGRCARFGGSGRVTVVNRGQAGKAALPYEAEDLDRAWEALGPLDDTKTYVTSLFP